MNKEIKRMTASIVALGIICIALAFALGVVSARSKQTGKVDPTVKHTSMTVQEIKENLPKYGFIVDRTDYDIVDEHGLPFKTTEYSETAYCFALKQASVCLVSSNIEDGMIYTSTIEVDEGGTQLEVLYINDPYTLELVAMNERITTPTSEGFPRNLERLYTFLDKEGYSWYDKHIVTGGDKQ